VAITGTPTPSLEPSAPTPIVSTAVSVSLQALPTATETPEFAENAGRTITMGDNGKTLTLQTGQRFVLMLDDRYVWEVIIAEPEVASPATGLARVSGSQGVYEAHQTGQTQLTATGDPLCRGQKPACMMPSLIFTLNITVN
jgi:hypothetical protein